jgi:hypothetical protein
MFNLQYSIQQLFRYSQESSCHVKSTILDVCFGIHLINHHYPMADYVDGPSFLDTKIGKNETSSEYIQSMQE